MKEAPLWWDPPGEEFWDPAHLIPCCWFEVRGRTTLGPHDVIVVRAKPRTVAQYWDAGAFWFWTDEVELAIDAELGIVRRMDTFGEHPRNVEVTEIEFDRRNDGRLEPLRGRRVLEVEFERLLEGRQRLLDGRS